LATKLLRVRQRQIHWLAELQILLVKQDLRREVLFENVQNLPGDAGEIFLLLRQLEPRMHPEIRRVQVRAGERQEHMIEGEPT